MVKKVYSVRIEENLMNSLDDILQVRGLSRTAFIEDYILTYTLHMQKSISKLPMSECQKCGKYFGGVVNCPNCAIKQLH